MFAHSALSIKYAPHIFRWLLPGICAVLLFGLSWPGLGGLWPLLLIAFTPILYLERECRERKMSSATYRWILFASFFAVNSLVLYFLLFINDSIAIRLLSFLTPVVLNTFWMTGIFWAHHRFSRQCGSILGGVFLVTGWMTLEWVEHHWTLAFPWVSLGNVLGLHPADAQWYAFTGISGGTLWVLVANLAFFTAISVNRRSWRHALFLAVWICIPPLWSRLEYSNNTGTQETLSFTIVQPCLDNYNEKFEHDLFALNIDRAFTLIEASSEIGEVVVFPETFLFESGQISGEQQDFNFSGLWVHQIERAESVKQLRTHMAADSISGVIAGAFVNRFYFPDEVAPAYASNMEGLDGRLVHYNSAIVLGPESSAIRHKGVLVAGVERIPFSEYLPQLNDWAFDLGGIVGSLGESEKISPVAVSGELAGVQICYDSAFGWLSRQLAQQGARVLVVLTNDSWWGQTPGHVQLLSFAQLRAIETGLPIVRAANNGISAFIDRRGAIVARIPWNEEGVMTRRVNLSDQTTFYTRFGDYLYLLAFLMLPITVLFAWRQKRRGAIHTKTIE